MIMKLSHVYETIEESSHQQFKPNMVMSVVITF
jgi:hypothetical protein